MLWRGAGRLRQLADQRLTGTDIMYKGKEIDQQVHLDLADAHRRSIVAANNGEVVHADHSASTATIIIDHIFASWPVPAPVVVRGSGQRPGRRASDQAARDDGLAGGDHPLAMLVNGDAVDTVEWSDRR